AIDERVARGSAKIGRVNQVRAAGSQLANEARIDCSGAVRLKRIHQRKILGARVTPNVDVPRGINGYGVGRIFHRAANVGTVDQASSGGIDLGDKTVATGISTAGVRLKCAWGRWKVEAPNVRLAGDVCIAIGVDGDGVSSGRVPEAPAEDIEVGQA